MYNFMTAETEMYAAKEKLNKSVDNMVNIVARVCAERIQNGEVANDLKSFERSIEKLLDSDGIVLTTDLKYTILLKTLALVTNSAASGNKVNVNRNDNVKKSSKSNNMFGREW